MVHVIESDGPGGAEVVFADLVRRVDDAGFRSVGVMPGRTDWLVRTLDGCAIRHARSTGWPKKNSFDLAYIRQLRQIFAEERPDIVHAHSFGCAVYAALALLGSRSKLVVTFHGEVDIVKPGRLAPLKWFLLRRAHALVCVSESLRAQAARTPGIVPTRTRAIHNGIDLARFSPQGHGRLRHELGVPDGTLLVGAAGNVRPAKSYEVLLQAASLLRQRGIQPRVVIAGENGPSPLVDRLMVLRTSLGLEESVTFVGYVDDVATYLNGLDVFVLSSRTEGFSISTVQALAAGLPVVATDCGGPAEIIEDGVSGILVRPESAESLADGLERVLVDAVARERLATAARQRTLREFSLDGMVERYEALYREALNGR